MSKLAEALVLVLALLLVVSSASAEDDEGEAKSPRRVTIAFQDREVKDVIAVLAELGGANVIMSPDVEGRVTLQFRDLPWTEALEQTAKAVDAVVSREDYGIFRIAPRPTKSAPDVNVAAPKRVSFAFTDTDIRTVIMAIADFAELNVILAPNVEGTVTVRLNDVPAKDAIGQIARTLGYVMLDEGAIRIAPKAKPNSSKISLTFKETDVRKAVEMIADFAALSVIVAPEVKGQVTATLHDVPARLALEQVVGLLGFVVREEVEGILRVEPNPATDR